MNEVMCVPNFNVTEVIISSQEFVKAKYDRLYHQVVIQESYCNKTASFFFADKEMVSFVSFFRSLHYLNNSKPVFNIDRFISKKSVDVVVTYKINSEARKWLKAPMICVEYEVISSNVVPYLEFIFTKSNFPKHLALKNSSSIYSEYTNFRVDVCLKILEDMKSLFAFYSQKVTNTSLKKFIDYNVERLLSLDLEKELGLRKGGGLNG